MTRQLLPLERLHALGLTDAEIAYYLPRLSRDAVRALDQQGWTTAGVESVMCEAAGPSWSGRLVTYYRQQLGLKTWPRRERTAAALDARRARLLHTAITAGWGHLSGRANRLARMLSEQLDPHAISLTMSWPESAVRAWIRQPWDLLGSEEVRLLSVLHERGQCPRSALAVQPRRYWNRQGRSWTAHLVRKGLAVCEQGTYRLADGVRRWVVDFTPTGIERRFPLDAS